MKMAVKEIDIRNPIGNLIQPTRKIHLNPDFSGNWTVVGDITGDGRLELISARNDDQAVCSIGTYNLKGDLLWTWGKPGAGSTKLTYDVPCQAYDLLGLGTCQVIFSDVGSLKILDGPSGKLLHSYPLPKDLHTADCITFANLQGNPRPTDIIIKSRYKELWAYDKNWNLLWKWAPKFGIKTCHHPTLVDIDHDGKDEVLAGHCMLDHNGKVMGKIHSRKARRMGHLDCARVVNTGAKAQDFRFIFTYCGARYFAMMDGTGKIIWEKGGYHFESIDVGHFLPSNGNTTEPQFYVDIDHTAFGQAENHIYDYGGNLKVCQRLNYGRQHRVVDWDGDGFDEIVISNNMALCKGSGERIGSFKHIDSTGTIVFPQTKENHDIHLAIIDYSKRGTGDLMIFTAHDVSIYENPSQSPKKCPHIEGVNFTFY
jgi:hypothetical protein